MTRLVAGCPRGARRQAVLWGLSCRARQQRGAVAMSSPDLHLSACAEGWPRGPAMSEIHSLALWQRWPGRLAPPAQPRGTGTGSTCRTRRHSVPVPPPSVGLRRCPLPLSSLGNMLLPTAVLCKALGPGVAKRLELIDDGSSVV